MIRRIAIVIGLQTYALMLAFAQLSIGVRTDEASALLNIPYPHPPLARFLLGWTNGWVVHEVFWRIVFATLLVQAAWLVADLARDLPRSVRMSLAAAWLLSAPVLLQTGTVLMVSLTALQGLVFVWLSHDGDDRDSIRGWVRPGAWGVGLLWLASLFTAYQALLYAPIVWTALRTRDAAQTRMQGRVRPGIILMPVFLLGLYTLTNPLILASLLAQGAMAEAATLLERLQGTGWIWLLAGSGILSVTGLIGLLVGRKWTLLASVLLSAAYVFFARHDSSAILFLPLLIAGLAELARRWRRVGIGTAFLVPVCTMLLLWTVPGLLPTRPAVSPERVLHAVEDAGRRGDVLIAGTFGHQWQYASQRPVRRYRARLLSEAALVLCLEPCEEMERQERWRLLMRAPVPVWVPLR